MHFNARAARYGRFRTAPRPSVRYTQTMSRHALRFWVLFFTPALALTQTPITIRVLQGDAAINSIRLHRGHDPVVQVVDRTGAPVSGAAVTFLLPATGPSAMFQDNGLSFTVPTGEDGKAAAHGLRPNRLEGQFRIRVTASYRGEDASAIIQQTNAEPAGKSHTSTIAIIAVIAGGAIAGGVAAASHGGSSGSSASQPPATTGGTPSTGATITPGSPVFGPPH